MMALLENVQREVRKNASQTLRHARIEVGIAAATEGEVDGPIELPKHVDGGLEGIERPDEPTDSCQT